MSPDVQVEVLRPCERLLEEIIEAPDLDGCGTTYLLKKRGEKTFRTFRVSDMEIISLRPSGFDLTIQRELTRFVQAKVEAALLPPPIP
jgi:hypothetical protein